MCGGIYNSGMMATYDEEARVILPDVLAILEAFEQEGVEYAVFGAVALNIHGIGRATEDLDLFIRPDPANIQRLRCALSRVYDDPHIDEITSEDLCGDYPAVRYVPPTGDFYLDILTRLGELASYESLEVETVHIDGIPVRVISPRELYRLKKNTIRGQDRVDAERLQEKFDFDDAET